jgi:PAS domain-containing protein
VLVRSTVTRDSDGTPLFVEGTVEDLTDRKAIETALRDHAARLTLALDAASMGDMDLDFARERSIVPISFIVFSAWSPSHLIDPTSICGHA